MKRVAFCATLVLCALLLLGCAAQAQDRTQASATAQAQVQENADAVGVMDEPLLQSVDESAEAGDNANVAKAAEQMDAPKGADKAAEKQSASAETVQHATPEPPAASKSEAKPASEPTPTPTPTPAPASKPEPAPTPEPTPAPAPEPDPAPAAASGDIYSVAEAVQAGNEYARAQYGVTIDITMTATDSSYFSGTADSVAWLAANGGQEALNRAARGNVDATFAYLAAMDGADTVSAYARFNCTVRYNAASDEYIVVVLYG